VSIRVIKGLSGKRSSGAGLGMADLDRKTGPIGTD
jgi:hypothetical protein